MSLSRIEGKTEFTKHMVRMRHVRDRTGQLTTKPEARSEGLMSNAVLGHRMLRLIDEAFRPEEAPPKPKAVEKKRTANGWKLIFIAWERYDGAWASGRTPAAIQVAEGRRDGAAAETSADEAEGC